MTELSGNAVPSAPDEHRRAATDAPTRSTPPGGRGH